MDVNSFILGMVKGKASVPVPDTQEKTVTVTENGTTEVLPDEGKLLSKVTVEANVAGGTLVAKTGMFVAAGQTHLVNHELGTTPVMVLVRTTGGYLNSQLTDTCIYLAMGMSAKAATAFGLNEDYQYGYVYNGYTNTQKQSTPDYTIEENRGFINKANETSVTIGGYSGVLVSGVSYTWYAIGIRES